MNTRLILLLTTLAAGPAFAAPAQVHLGWQGPTDTTMTVTWRSAAATGAVEYGKDGSYGQVQAAVSVAYQDSYLHEAQLTGLAPGTSVSISVRSPGRLVGGPHVRDGPGARRQRDLPVRGLRRQPQR